MHEYLNRYVITAENLLRKKVYLHKLIADGLEEIDLKEAIYNVKDLVSEYEEKETDRYYEYSSDEEY